MNLLQSRASNPDFSIWVSASAGTGKTKILTDRVLRLLLKGESLNSILCLTFTNAAAGEMKERIISSLSKWSTLNESELKLELENLLGKPSTKHELLIAQGFYNSYIKSGENINIHTIHSFCQKLLKNFPIEADVCHGFKTIDEIETESILKYIKNIILTSPDLKAINDYLATNFHELILEEIFNEIIQQKTKILACSKELSNSPDEVISLLNKNFEDNYYAFKAMPLIQDLIGYDIMSSEVKKFFLTETGEKRKRIVNQKIAKPGSGLYSDLERIQDQIYLLNQHEKHSHLHGYSKLISVLSNAILDEYESYKRKKGILDYDDLIIKASTLLNQSDLREWVLYKLDEFINHLLVDEAQDTSIDQWTIIQALITEFYSGESRLEKIQRTIFVVGDEKQSIFSFQGANVESFAKMNSLLKSRMLSANKNFENINLEISYRSAKEILEVVFHVFNKIHNQNPHMFINPITQLNSFRNGHVGHVELWPLCKVESKEDFWPVVNFNSIDNCPKVLLAKKISSYIKDSIRQKKILQATGKIISFSDFMILFRRRDDLTKEVIKALQEDGLDVSGLDRINLKENLSVQDLLSVARFVLNNHNDLNLASLLKSPIIGISEERLYILATIRDKLSIWDYLLSQRKSKEYSYIVELLESIINLYKATDLSAFFHHIIDVFGFRQKLNSTNRLDSNDSIDELLYACQHYISYNDDSLQNFLFWIDSNESSTKRDNSSNDKIRIMTVHGSKGLQAPIVILCDTTSVPLNNDMFLWKEDGKFLFVKSSKLLTEDLNNLKNNQQQKTYAEYLRLLYVGMTRAEDTLIVCGYEGKKPVPENCWYELVRKTIKEIGEEQDGGALTYGDNTSLMHNQELLSSNNNSNVIPFPIFNQTNEFQTKTLCKRKIAEHKRILKFDNANLEVSEVYSPNKEAILPKSIQSFSLFGNSDPIKYGIIFHKILEDALSLKDLNIMLSHPLINVLDDKDRNRIYQSIKKIISNEDFCDLLQNNFLTEVSIGSTIVGNIKIGRIDLMIHLEKEILIIDYKSDSKPALNQQDVSINYKNQLSLYASIVAKMYPNKIIRTKILWLESGKLMEI